jgi:hypothetical protein
MNKRRWSVWEQYVIFNGKDKVDMSDPLLGKCDDYARAALEFYQKKRLIRALFWAVMAAAASSFEAAYIQAGKDK